MNNNDILEFKRLKEDAPIMVATLPRGIVEETKEWVRECRKIKNHPLAELKAHNNIGYKYRGTPEQRFADSSEVKYNSYQVAVPGRLVEDSFWLAYVLRACSKYYGGGKPHRLFKIRSWKGHFDAFDLWANFAYKGDSNPTHNHVGFLSGVIYCKNHGHPTHFDQYNCSYEGKDGTMVIFPSQVDHHVETQTANKERITFAFNIIQLPTTVSEEF